jgi:hypothetical protein
MNICPICGTLISEDGLCDCFDDDDLDWDEDEELEDEE